MKEQLRKRFIITIIFTGALLLTSNYAVGAMVVFLKDGRVIQLPVNCADIIGISFEENSSVKNKNNRPSYSPEKSTGVDTCTNHYNTCIASTDNSYTKCKERAGSNEDIKAQCEQDNSRSIQACKDRLDQCIKD